MQITKPRIAIQNLHKLPNLATWKIHNYVVELAKRGHVQYLYFDEKNIFDNYRTKLSALNQIRKQYSWTDLGLNQVQFIFSGAALRRNVDVLLNFNHALPDEFTPAVKAFEGLKIFHLMDYFWKEPGSAIHERLVEHGIDYVMNYGQADVHCEYFKKVFPTYLGRVIPVPFGYSDRFVSTTEFNQRDNKCVALGSVNPLRPYDADPVNYTESAALFANEEWFHKFRRMIVESMDLLHDQVDSMLPVFPKYKDASYDIVKKLNGYRMFTNCESLFYFPSAKTFEGVACGAALVCSDHPCFANFGFQDTINCIVHNEFNITSFKDKIAYYQNNSVALEAIAHTGHDFVLEYYNHGAIADNLARIVEMIYSDSHSKVALSDKTLWPVCQVSTN